MKEKRIVMAVAVLVLVLAMACALVSCDLFGGGSGGDDKDTTYEVSVQCDISLGSVSGGGKFKQGDSVTIIATANEGYSFVGWYNGENKVSDQAEWTFSMGEKAISYTAKFSVNSYTVNLDCDLLKGSVTGDGNYEYGSSVTIVATAKTGYAFVGWYEGDNLVSDEAEYIITNISQNATYIAKFSANKHTVIVECNSTQGSVAGGGNYDYGSNVAIKAIANDGYTFIGWYDGETLISSNSEYIFLMDDFDKKYTAIFEALSKVTLECDLSQGSVGGSGYYVNGSSVAIFATAKVGYAFLGWFDGETLISNENNYNFFIGEADVNYIAKFKSLPKITLEYDKLQGSVTGGGYYDNGTSVTISATANTGYSFLGWYDGEEVISTVATYTFVMGQNDVKYIAKFSINRYMVNLDYDSVQGSVTGGGEYEYNSTVTITATANDGYSFVGWYDGTICLSEKPEYTFAMGNKNDNIRAVFKVLPKVILECDILQGRVIGEGSYNTGNIVTITAIANNGYTFLGWYNGESLITVFPEYKFYMGDNSITYIAKFKANNYTLELMCDSTQGSVTGGGEYDFGSSVTISAIANYGYTFIGWYDGNELVSKQAKNTFVMGDKSITYIAKFIVNCYDIKVECDSTQGYVTGGGKYDYGSNVTLTATPKIGYSFVGWYENETLISIIAEFNFIMTYNDTVLTAKFRVNEYFVELERNVVQGNVTGDGYYDYGSRVTISATANLGYSFVGWYVGEVFITNKAEYTFFMGDSYIKYTARFVIDPSLEIFKYTKTYDGVFIINGLKDEYKDIDEIVIPSFVSQIADNSFSGCSSLCSVVIPGNVKKIGNYAFTNCKNLSNVVLAEGITSVGSSVFQDCISLISLIIPDSVTNIGASSFNGCISLTSITMSDKLTSIAPAMFYACKKLTSIIIPDSVANIGDNAFYGCNSLYNLVIPNNVKSIGSSAFKDCNNIVSIVLPDSVISLGRYVFKNCNKLINVTLGNAVTSIGDYTFYGCSSLTSVTIPDSVASIGEYAFSGCSSLTSVIIGNSVTSIGSSAFYGCSSLTSITIGSGVTSIGNWAFSGCRNISVVQYNGTITQWCAISGIDNLMEHGLNKKFLIGSDEVSNLVIPNSVTSIGTKAFYGCSSLTSVTIPDSVTIIGESAFRHCSSLTSVTIGNSVTNIGVYSFNDCNSLTNVTIGSGVKSIDMYSFDGCRNISVVQYNGTITQWCAISGIDNLMENGLNKKFLIGSDEVSNLVIPDGVTSIQDYTFYRCTGITSLIISDSVISIGNSAFMYTNIVSVKIGNYVKNIGDNAFFSCSELASVTIGSSVTIIGVSAFGGCNKITEVRYNGTIQRWCSISGMDNLMYYGVNKKFYIGENEVLNLVIPDDVTNIEKSAFRNCSNLTNVKIGKSVTNIGDFAFYGCNSLANVTISDSVNSIGEYAFFDCSRLISITIGNGLISIGNVAFNGCKYITEVRYNGTINQWCAINGLDNLMRDCSNIKLYIGDNEITSLVIPNSVTSIDSYAFSGCSSLTSVTIPNSVTSIGSSAFSNCISLTSVTIGNSITSIGSSAFSNCINISDVRYNGTVTQWFGINGLRYLMDNGSNKKLFIEDHELTELVVPEGLMILDDYIFYGCSSIKSVMIPDSVTCINYGAFEGCINLTNIIIGSGVTTIKNGAFQGCFNVAEVQYNGTIRQWCAVKGLDNLPLRNKKFYIGSQEITGDLIIPNDVTNIEGYAFYECSGLTSVTIPNSVTSIGNSAFYGCSGLTSITIPDSVTSIGEEAFFGCSDLTSITIPDSVTSIGEEAFFGCFALTEVYNLSSLNIIKGSDDHGYVAYYACDVYTSFSETSKITENDGMILYTAGENVILIKYIGDSNEVVIPDNVTSISDYAFSGCSALTSVTIGSGVTSIGSYAFRDCYVLSEVYNMSSLNIVKGSTDYGYVAYYARDVYNSLSEPSNLIEKDGMILHIDGENETIVKYIGNETNVIIPNNITSIGYSAFSGCSSLTSITIPDSMTSIGWGAFSGCSGLTSITIPDSVTSIGNSAFDGCSGLTSITIPDSVTSIGNWAFDGCSGLTSITIPDSVTIIGSGAFSGCNSLTSVTIPESVTVIGSSTFYKCSSLTSVIIPNSVTRIGETAFFECSSLTSVTIPDSVTSIGSSAFSGCSSLTSVTIPDSVTSIGSSAFSGCSSLTSVTIPDSVTSIGWYAFYNCLCLTSVTIGSNVISIGSSAFSGCSSLTSVIIPNSVTSIGTEAFFYCSSLTSVTIGSGVTSIGIKAFYACSRLTSLTIPDSVTSIEEYAFADCRSLTSVNIGSGVTSIGNSAFYGCIGLTSITIPDSVTYIGYEAFYKCTGLTSVSIGSGVTSIGSYAFYGCSSLTSVTFENMSGWFVSTSSGATSGTAVTVTDPSQNAKYLTSTYCDYYWKRK